MIMDIADIRRAYTHPFNLIRPMGRATFWGFYCSYLLLIPGLNIVMSLALSLATRLSDPAGLLVAIALCAGLLVALVIPATAMCRRLVDAGRRRTPVALFYGAIFIAIGCLLVAPRAGTSLSGIPSAVLWAAAVAALCAIWILRGLTRRSASRNIQ